MPKLYIILKKYPVLNELFKAFEKCLFKTKHEKPFLIVATFK